MKYEAVFGDQSLFDGANDCHVFACKKDGGAIYWHDHSILSAGSVTVRGCIAMRRIIAEPKRWTVEDKKAGRLPEVGGLVEYSANNDHGDTDVTAQWRNSDELEILRGQNKNKAFVVFNKRTEQSSNLIINCMKPIEVPEEKAQREEDEFVDSLIDKGLVYTSFYVEGLRAAYRKLKGGE